MKLAPIFTTLHETYQIPISFFIGPNLTLEDSFHDPILIHSLITPHGVVVA